MKELIQSLEQKEKADYLLDTCFLLYMLKNGHVKALENFCGSCAVGMSSFNLDEIEHVHHKMKGSDNHHLRDFLKNKYVCCVPIPVHPGDWDGEKDYVRSFDPELLHIVPDVSDAVLLVHALKIGASVLTRDRHHVFTAIVENKLSSTEITVLNELPT